ncbi:MAG TPA: glycosyltransferase family 25 protein, partial [Burkholderiaceae bacterium]|nr:glycosyltransferase family 25 protein [Burkholderiaceae bacterium]
MDGFYINLDRSTDRRDAMESQLQALAMPWVRRFPALDGALHPTPTGAALGAGERACFVSHAQAIAAPSAGGLRLVLEDDVQIAQDLPAIIGGFGLSQLDAYDLVFLDCQPQVNAMALMTLWSCLQTHRIESGSGRVGGVNLYDAGPLYQFGATGYLVTPAGRERLVPLLQAELHSGPGEPFD